MEKDIVVRKVTQDVLMFVWYKQEIIEKKPSPELSFVPEVTAELMKNLCISVWIDSYCNEFIWAKYCNNHFKRMTASQYLFAIYVSHACHILNRSTTNAYAGFCGTISLMTHFVLHCWQEERKEFLNTCVDLFCTFFEKEIRTKFDEQGGWQNFNKYLVENHERLKRCKDLIRTNQSEYEIFKEIQEEHQQNTEPYVIDGVVLQNITEITVEENEEAVSFAESVTNKMRELCKQTFTQVLADFAKTDKQVEELYRQTVGEATGGIASDAEQSCLQKDQENFNMKPNDVEQSFQKDKGTFPGEASKVEQSSSQEVLESNPTKTSSKKNKDQTVNLDSLKSQDVDSATRELDPSPKLTNTERAKILLYEMLDDIPKINELIKFVCMKYPIQALETIKNV